MFLFSYIISSVVLFLLSFFIYLLYLKITTTSLTKKDILIHSLFIYIVSLIITITGLPTLSSFQFVPNINLEPWTDFHHLPTQYIYNIIMFIPVGFLTPFLLSSKFQSIKTIFFGFFFSCFIEFFQLFNIRATDIDDLIANTLGGIIGYIIFKLFFFSPNKNNHFLLPLKLLIFVFLTYFSIIDFISLI